MNIVLSMIARNGALLTGINTEVQGDLQGALRRVRDIVRDLRSDGASIRDFTGYTATGKWWSVRPTRDEHQVFVWAWENELGEKGTAPAYSEAITLAMTDPFVDKGVHS